MKKYFVLICTIVLIITACNSIQTPIVSPVTTSTSTGFHDQAPATSTITPLPTIPTFTATFDISKIVTATPAEKANCPKEKSETTVDFLIPNKLEDILDPALLNEQKVLAYLNSGGSTSQLIDKFKNSFMDKKYFYQDFTQDGLNELLIKFHTRHGHSYYSIFTCINSAYKSFNPVENFGALGSQAYVLTIEDMNKNGLPEIVIADGSSYFIIEWIGSNFTNIAYDSVNNQWPDIHSPSERGKIEDINHDGFDDLVLTGADIYYYGFNESYYEGFPWRDEIRIYVWNGELYSQLPSEYSKPEYRFQAVQDGDRLTAQKGYERALELYQSVIFDDKLRPWSAEMHGTQVETPKSLSLKQSTPTLPAPDVTEYTRLAAYAYYRIMLIQLTQGQEMEATTTYQTLHDTFGKDHHGSTYVVMATTFWNAYQLNHEMYDGCAAAIQYAVEHPEILIPLGSDYHGAQSHIYIPADVCPFR